MKNVLLSVLLSAAGTVIGLVLIRAPGFCIELQRRFYALLNWRIEPISMKRELRSTRLLGLFLVILCVFGLVFTLFFALKNPWWCANLNLYGKAVMAFYR